MWMNTQIVALDTTEATYFTPWFPRGADNAVFSAEIVQDTFGTKTLKIKVYTKNVEDEGSGGSPVDQLASLFGNFYEVNTTGLKELVRFGLNFQASAAGEGAVFRLLPPTWYDKAV